MTDVAIRCDGLAKQYRIGEREPYRALRDVITDAFASPFRRFRSTLRRSSNGSKRVEKMSFWALNDVSFEIKRGEVVGIIGRNGAGKSTLLKILSRITEPTEGHADIWGRVGSLLEVGTGFHPELTGRDNIFLNGAILGMTKQEIKNKFDEIVDFAGVERYIDTPVKRYTSGMYVRLAFGVAAHLDPDILIVDEVLAVGDAEFQKKCLGKMKDVSGKDGRTVLFVSHNMTAIKNLCNSIIYLKNGMVEQMGDTNQVINYYLSNHAHGNLFQKFDTPENAPGNEFVRLKRIEVISKSNNDNRLIYIDTPIDIEFEFWNSTIDKEINLSLVLNTFSDECVFNVATKAKYLSKGIHKGICQIPANLLNDGLYKISMMMG